MPSLGKIAVAATAGSSFRAAKRCLSERRGSAAWVRSPPGGSLALAKGPWYSLVYSRVQYMVYRRVWYTISNIGSHITCHRCLFQNGFVAHPWQSKWTKNTYLGLKTDQRGLLWDIWIRSVSCHIGMRNTAGKDVSKLWGPNANARKPLQGPQGLAVLEVANP